MTDKAEPCCAEADDVLEADTDRQADEAENDQRRLGRSDSFNETQRMERLMELDAQQLADSSNNELESPLRAMREAEQLGQDAQRGLESELARERDSDDSKAASAGLQNSKDGSDPYEQQLEAELEDHLCKLRLEERRASAQRAQGTDKPIKEGAPTPTPVPGEFVPPERQNVGGGGYDDP
eukprot:TRINITY_DN41215_c0_g1_i1.p1 TRINITY_DN41215_c0_g1~~TRINITY_DN41215_c0_g1_i1.p1  ORF type:complete len:212 (-),score=56.90 TRINITY_DN41215_c0_g1_i1:84-626(-)